MFNEGKACDAVIRLIEAREKATRQQVTLPERDKHPNPIEISCIIGDKLYAIEHTGIESFEGQIRTYEHLGKFFFPIKEQLDKILPDTEYFQLFLPVEATQLIKKQDIPKAQEVIISWIKEVWESLPIGQLGDFISDEKDTMIPGLPFPLSLYRYKAMGILKGLHDNYMAPTKLQDSRRQRIERAYDKKLPKLMVWKNLYKARTVLIFEDHDISLGNWATISKTTLEAIKDKEEKPDEIYLVTTCIKNPWYVTKILIDGVSFFDYAEHNLEIKEIDSTTLISLTEQ